MVGTENAEADQENQRSISQVSPCVSATLPDSLALVQTLNITEREIKARTKAQAAHSSTAHLSERQH
jgi:hypothetical protein